MERVVHNNALSRSVSLTFALGLVACAKPPAPPAPAPEQDLVRRHYDQVCRVSPTERPVVTIEEIFDTTGVSSELVSLGPQSLPRESGSDELEWASLDFIVRYTRDGHPGVAGVWATTLDDALSREVERLLTPRIRRLPGLLQDEGFRTVVTLSPRPSIAVGSPVACFPHMRHRPGERPQGLPEDVRVVTERPNYRPRAAYTPEASRATVRIHLDRHGGVSSLDPLVGDSSAVARAQSIIAQLRFDPALRNGEGVASALVLTLRFSGR